MFFSESSFDLEHDGTFLVSAGLLFSLILSVLGLSFRLYEANMEDRDRGNVRFLEGLISASCVGLVSYIGYLLIAIYMMDRTGTPAKAATFPFSFMSVAVDRDQIDSLTMAMSELDHQSTVS